MHLATSLPSSICQANFCELGLEAKFKGCDVKDL